MNYIKVLLSTFLLTFSLLCIGQSPQSDSIYAIGVELYRQGNYNEAINQFEKSNQLDYEELDSLSPRREYSSMWLASCLYKLGKDTEARKVNINYKSEPVDRRLTVTSDSICAEIVRKIQKQFFISAIQDIREVQRLEHQICNEDNFFHLGTFQMKCQCFVALQKVDSALCCAEEIFRIERVYFDDTDTLLLGALDMLYQLNFYKQNFAKAKAYNDQASVIIKSNYGSSDRRNANIDFRDIELHLVKSEWEEAHKELLTFIDMLNRYFSDDYDIHLNVLFQIRNDFNICKKTKDVEIIDSAIAEVTAQQSAGEELMGLLVRYSSCIEKHIEGEANQLEKEIDKILKKHPSKEYRKQRALYLCLKSAKLMNNGDTKKAQKVFNQIANESLDSCLMEEPNLRVVYLAQKGNMCFASNDDETGFEAYSEAIQIAGPGWLKQNPIVYASLAVMYSFAENYTMALSVTKTAIEEYESIVQRGGFRIEKDTADIGQIVRIYQKELKNSYWMPDTVRYVLRDIECQYIQLLTRLMTNEKNFQLDIDYLDQIIALASELIKIDKYFEAQEVLDDYLSVLQQYYDKIDPTSTANEDEFDRLIIKANKEDALEFRRQCFEKGDPNGHAAYLEYAEYIQMNYPEDSIKYEEAMADYYRYSDNRKALADYLKRTIDAQGETNTDLDTYRDLIGQLDAGNDYETKQKYLKSYLLKLLDEYKKGNQREWEIENTIGKICNNYLYQQDTIGLLCYYQKELWPSFDRLGDDYTFFFFQSIYQLDRKVKNKMIVNYIYDETKRKPSCFSNNEVLACVDQGVAGILTHAGFPEEGRSYLEEAINKVPKDDALKTLFAYGIYDSWYNIDFTYPYSDTSKIDSLFLWGHYILQRASKHKELMNTIEICELIGHQATILPYISQPLEYCGYYKVLLKEYINKKIRDIDHIYTKSKKYKGIRFISDATLPKASYILWERELIVGLYKLSRIYPDEAGDFALNMVHYEMGTLNTSININSVDSYESEDLINYTSKYAYEYQTDSLKIYAYNTALLCKGLQLRSENNIKSLIKESGHISALRKYEELLYINNLTAQCNESQRDSLRNRAHSLENELARLSGYFGDYKKSLFTTWQAVQQQLGEDDIAIEFTYVTQTYGYDNLLNTNGALSYDTSFPEGYYACIVKKGMKTPEIVFVADENSFKATNNSYKDSNLTRIITSPLDSYLIGVRNIYFSPIGEINQLAIESLPLVEDESKTLSDKYNLYRLSSTKELVVNNLHIKGKDAVVYGGLKYDMSIDELEKDATKYPEIASRDVLFLPDVAFLSRVPIKGIPYLKGSKIEAEEIVNTINETQDSTIVAQLFTGDEGTEASFKALTGKKKRIIHIATHGFYDQGSASNKEDQALLYSGLFFSGAENTFQGERTPSNVEDGVLSAIEIASIDLSGLDLVVLSACQTAQGYVTGEGVFGLQRGFKKAGANSILMSLWKVDDNATCLLMTEFYKNWISEGMTKHDALEAAKRTVRSHTEKGWDDPKYWAAFILLDALD